MAVNLVKGQKISLEKDGKLDKVFMGLGWDMAKSSGAKGLLGRFLGGGEPRSIDLDASCAMFDKDKNLVDVVYFGHLQSNDRSVQHSGDNLTGEGEGDDEVIRVNLSKVPANVQSLVFTVSSYQGQTFDQIENASCRLVDDNSGKEIANLTITGGGAYTGLIMTKLYRHGGEWKMAAIGEPMQSKTVADLVEPIEKFI